MVRSYLIPTPTPTRDTRNREYAAPRAKAPQPQQPIGGPATTTQHKGHTTDNSHAPCTRTQQATAWPTPPSSTMSHEPRPAGRPLAGRTPHVDRDLRCRRGWQQATKAREGTGRVHTYHHLVVLLRGCLAAMLLAAWRLQPTARLMPMCT